MDGVMSSHVNPNINDKFKEGMNRNYGKHGKVKSNVVKVHKYPGMIFYLQKKER